MADEIATLIFKAESGDLVKAEAVLKRLPGQAGKSERASNGLASGFKRLAITAVSVGTAVTTMNRIISGARSMDVINAQLKTATGSAEGAVEAFEAISEFAAETPFLLDEVVDGFVKMRNLGLDPGEEALTSYGNTAAAMGKSLNQMIEAVADASTGEFERLKEFGIKARTQGENVSFTFQGVTTTVKKNSEEITNYLRRIGDENFAGAMAERAATLDGALSNLEDSWNKLWMSASQNGAGEEMERQIRDLAELLQDPETIEAVQTLANAMVSAFSGAAEVLVDTVNWVEGLGEAIAEAIHGPAVDDLAAFEEELAGINERMAELNEIFGKTGGHSWRNEEELQGLIERKIELQNLISLQKELNSAAAEDQLQEIVTPDIDRLTKFKVKSADPAEEGGSGLDARRQKELEDLKRSFFDEAELEAARYQDKLDKIKEFEKEKGITQAEAREMELLAQEEHAAKMMEIELAQRAEKEQTFRDALSLAESYYAGMQGKEAAYARAAIQGLMLLSDTKKRLALKNSIIKGHEAIQEAIASAPFPANLPAVGFAAGKTAVSLAGIAGARAQGGQTLAGENYIVGENGPEVLSMGSRNGRIFNQDQLGQQGGGETKVVNQTTNVNITTMDEAGVADWAEKNQRILAGAVNREFEESGRSL